MISKIESNNHIEFSPLCIGRLNKSYSLSKVLPLVDTLHLDIMDHTFVKSKAFSIKQINNFKCDKPKHVHVMSKELDNYILKLNNIDSLSFHYEATVNHYNFLEKINKRNFKAGIVVNSETTVDEIKHILPHIDRIILMAVPPGFSGQKFIETTIDKIRQLRILDKNIHIAIDGGMNEDTIFEVTAAGANSCIVCSVIIKSENISEKIISLKNICKKGSFQYQKKNYINI